jgi:hypothetical protein
LSAPQKSTESLGSAHLCELYELRITRRCLEDDLEYFGEAPFEELAKHEIVKALVNRRSDSPDDTRAVAPLSRAKRVYRLAYGDRHRGATWYDERHGVVWLLAYAQHQFEDRGDAFPYFKELDAEGKLLPAPVDYEALLRERDDRLQSTIGRDAERLLLEARETPGREVVGVLGGSVEVTVAITVVEPLRELHVAVQMVGVAKEHFVLALAVLFEGKSFEEIETADAMPSRALRPGELGFRALLD